MAKIQYKYRLELIDPDKAMAVPEGVCGSSFKSWKDIKLPISIENDVLHYWADGWDTIRGVKVVDVKSVMRQTYCDDVLVIEEPIWKNEINYKYRLDLIDSTDGMFVPEDKTEPDGSSETDFVSWEDIKLPVTIEKGVLRYWADGWDTVRGTMLSNVKSIMRQVYLNDQLIIEEPIWKNT